MLSKEDEVYLDNQDYSLPLEKFYFPTKYHNLNLKNGTISQVYGFSNERIDALFCHFSFKGKSILTVGSSGDQALNAILRGANNITLIDANIFTKAYVEYKISAIKNLSFEEFSSIFLSENIDPFNHKIYAKISHGLPKDVQIFWDNIILEQNESKDTYEYFVHQETWRKKTLSKCFKCKEDYYKLRQKLEHFKINYVYSEFNDFASKINQKYDIILLSNIYQYVASRDGIDAFTEVVNNLYENYLNNGGKIQIHYQFNNMYKQPLNFSSIFPDKKINFAMVGNQYSYYISKPLESLKTAKIDIEK